MPQNPTYMKKFSLTKWLIAVLVLMQASAFAGPPPPQKGYRWVLVAEYSDEFNGTSLDKTKWRDSFDGWKGRSPAMFKPNTISVNGGNMIIRNQPMAQDGDYNIACGAVQSLNKTAHFGYYECKFKASRISMSTTFWMSNKKTPIIGATKLTEDCANDKWSQELDICESIGGTGNFSTKFQTQMNFNTHYRYVDCNSSPEKFYSAGNNAVEGNGQTADAGLIGSESWEDFHTYGCYWKDSKNFDFYVDGKFAGAVVARTDVVDHPFSEPMGINMVTETYNWAKPYPTTAELTNDNINASYYDYIRSYKLVPVDDQSFTGFALVDGLYPEELAFPDFDAVRGISATYDFVVSYQANENRDIFITIKDASGTVVKSTKYTALAGYGTKSYPVALSAPLANGTYTVETEIRATGSSATINTATKTLTVSDEVLTPQISFVDLPVSIEQTQTIPLTINYTADEERELVAVINLPDGTWLGNAKKTVQAGSGTVELTINLADMPAIADGYKLSCDLRPVGGPWDSGVVRDDAAINITGSGNGSEDCVADYEEVNGLVVIEAENLPLNESWKVKTTDAGYSGTGYIEWTGTEYFNNVTHGVIETTIKINTPGTYEIKLHETITDDTHGTTEHNDTWLKMEGDRFYAIKSGKDDVYPRPYCQNNSLPCPEGSSIDGFFKLYVNSANWKWANSTYDNDPHYVHVDFNNPGVYKLTIAARSSYNGIDRIVLYNKATVTTATAQNLSNPETPCGGGAVIDPIEQEPYTGTPITLPGTIESENYDKGGEGLAYHDTEAENKSGEYRTDGVDIEVCKEGGYNLSWIADGEWLEYTVNVTEAGTYTFTTRAASLTDGGSFHFEVDGKPIGGTQTVPVTEDWQVYTDIVLADIELTKGEHTFKYVSESAGYNLDKIVVAKSTATENEPIQLTAGWNLIGYPYEESADVETALSSIIDKVILVKNFDGYYDPSDPTFSSLMKLEWGQGYFVKVSADCELKW